MDIKVRKLDLGFTKTNYPTLFEALGRIEGLTELQKQRVASLCLEIALNADGTTDIFQDDLNYTTEDE
jgi:hypothetical protein